jgi:O-antigen/teichoic acid export membrane protein
MSISVLPFSFLHLHAELLKSIKKITFALCIQNVVVPLIASAALLVLAQPLGVIGAALSSSFAAGIVLFLSIYLWRRATPKLKTAAVISIDNATILASSSPLFVVAIMNILIDFSDTVLLGFFLDSSAVGIYTIALRLTAISSLILSSVNSVIAPEFSTLWAENKTSELNALARSTTRLMSLVACCILAIFLLLPETLLGLFGSEFIAGKTVLITLACAHFIALATGPVAYILMMTGNERFHRTTVLICAGLNIVLNCLLIPIYGIVGAAIATAIALSTKNILAVLFVRSKLGIKVIA